MHNGQNGVLIQKKFMDGVIKGYRVERWRYVHQIPFAMIIKGAISTFLENKTLLS